MPAATKRVHFDIPPTPSPTFSNASLPSEAGLSTPPQHMYSYTALPSKHPQPQRYYYSDSPSSFASLPYVSGQVRLHPSLVAAQTALVWDMVHPPSTAFLLGTPHPQPLSPVSLAEPATHPPLPAMTLICDLLPWSIAVTPKASPVVTVGDVLHALYRALRLPVSAAELSFLPPDSQTRVHAAFYARHRLLADARLRREEKAKGVKRVDFLMEARRFAGLSIVVGPGLGGRGVGEVWAVQLALA